MKEGQTQEPVGGMKNVPQKIYLQVDADGETPEDFKQLDVTWCVDKINDTDIEYTLTPPPSPLEDKEVEDNFEEWVTNTWKESNNESAACRGAARYAFEWVYDYLKRKDIKAGYVASLPQSSTEEDESGFDKELLMMASWIDKIGVDNTAITRGAAKIKIGSALKRMLEYNPYTHVTGESEAIEKAIIEELQSILSSGVHPEYLPEKINDRISELKGDKSYT